MRSPRENRVLRFVAAAGVCVALLATGVPSAGAVDLPVPKPSKPFAAAPEPLARYVGQVSCEPTTKPGTLALRQLILDTYGLATVGTLRACASGSRSEHKDGRALDWMLDSQNQAEATVARGFLDWLLGPDTAGEAAGNARRLGVMYVIWDRRTWQSWTGRWSEYTGANPHTDHMHISLSWDGAMKRTSWWTGTTVTRYDYGPCQKYIGELAPRYTSPRYTSCPAAVPRPGQAFPRLWDADRTADVLATSDTGALMLYPGSGDAAFQRPRQVGRGWGVMRVVTASGDFDKDSGRDLLATDGAGRLLLYRGDGAGGFVGARQVGRGWGAMDVVLGVGDLDADGSVDVLARRASDGRARLYPGDGRGGFLQPRDAGDLRGLDLVTAVGDWDGDSRPDVVGRRPDGRLMLHRGTSDGRLGAAVQIGRGWGVMDALLGTGDFSGDGEPDLLARRGDGTLWLYRGNGGGGWGTAERVGTGWRSFALVG